MPALPSLVATILRMSNDALSVSRPNPTGYDGTGTATSAAPTTFAVPKVYQERPASTGMLKHLPEGDRKKRTVEIWTPTELQFRDLVTLGDGEVYEVQHVEPWDGVASFWRAVGLKSAQAGSRIP